jgi:hypothetical protein
MLTAGAYILENTPPLGGGISADVIWGKKYERQREKGGKCKRKRKKGERKGKEKGRMGKENEKRGSKRVK